MILEYHRPQTLEQALALLERDTPLTLPLAGGTVLSRMRKPDVAVVDLQALNLNAIAREGQLLQIGAAATLQQLYETVHLPETLAAPLRRSLAVEAGQNMRQTASVGGTIISSDGRSPFVTALLALDPRLVWAAGELPQPLGDFLPMRSAYPRRLLLNVQVALNITLRLETVGRAPLDRPVLVVALARWPSGRARVVVGGFGAAPVLALDGPEPGGAADAVREACQSAEDEWATAAYRMDAAAKLVSRMLAESALEGTVQ